MKFKVKLRCPLSNRLTQKMELSNGRREKCSSSSVRHEDIQEEYVCEV